MYPLVPGNTVSKCTVKEKRNEVKHIAEESVVKQHCGGECSKATLRRRV